MRDTLKIRNLKLFIFIKGSDFAVYEIMASNKKIVKKDEDLEELDEMIIRKIESYIDEKLKPIFEKAKIKKDYYEMSFL